MLYVYLLRGSKSKIQCDGQHIADLEDFHYIKLNVSPRHSPIKVRESTIVAAFEANGALYIRFSREGYPARYKLRLASPDEAAEEIRKRGIVANDPERTYSAECSPPAASGKPSF